MLDDKKGVSSGGKTSLDVGRAEHIDNVAHAKANAEYIENVARGKGDDGRDLDTIEETNIGSYVWLVTLAAAIGGLLFGYDTGVISGVLVVLKDDLGHELTSSEKELITSITSGGAFLGSILAGLTADKFGRKMVISVACVIFTVGAIIQAAAYGLAQMTIGRLVIGWGVGQASMVVPVYISELAPAKHRGRMVVVNSMCITGGQVIAYAIDAAFTHVPHGWRYMVGLGGLPSLVLLGLLPFCPETPRQLVTLGRHDEAVGVLHKIYPHASEQQCVDKVALLIRGTEEARDKGHGVWESVKQLYTVPGNFRALFVACFVIVMQQMSGFNTLMYYSATLFAMVGFTQPAAVGLVIAGTNFLFTGVAFKYIDRFGRRRMLLYTIWGMVLALTVAAIAFHWIPVNAELEVTAKKTNWAGILVLVSLILYVAFYATGLGSVAWQANELLPMEVRSTGTMMVTAACWAFNCLVSSSFLSMMETLTPSGSFGFYAAVGFVGWITIMFIYPEVSGMNLEDVREVFAHGFGVTYAEKLRKERKAALREQRAVETGNGV